MYVTNRERHNQAMLAPRSNIEKAIVQLVRGLQQYSSLTTPDNEGMADIANGLLKLIDPPSKQSLDRLDPAVLSEELACFLQAHSPDTRSALGTLALVSTGQAQAINRQ